MQLLDVHTLKQRITRLIEDRCSDSEAAQVIASNLDRLELLHRSINSMPRDEALEAAQVLYTRMEEVVMRFELLDSLRRHLKPTPLSEQNERAVRRHINRMDKINEAIEWLPEPENTATTVALYQELDRVINGFIEAKLSHQHQARSAKCFPGMPQRPRWN